MNDDTWISAAETHERVSSFIHFHAAEAICGRAFDGLIKSRARLLIIGEKRSEGAIIPHEFWWAKGHPALEQKWPTGDFETWIDQRIHCRAYGVEFLESDIDAMLPTQTSGRKVKPAVAGNFAPSARCIAELQKSLNCTKEEAGQHILRFCRASLIESRCESIRWEVDDILRPSEQEKAHVAIPTWFWDHCTTGRDAILNWDSGTFAGRGLVEGKFHKVRITGAEFDVGGIVDLETMLKGQAIEAGRAGDQRIDREAKPVATGGRPRSEKWIDWIAEFVAHIHLNGFPDGDGVEGQDALIAAVDERLIARGLEGPSRSTVQPVARAALLRLRSAEN
ncbi:MAG: hypothetical protein U9R73_11335 [Pseudomonadota bacterium]|jgi:hypothetical protein|nr:hypothetical protein [Pseudomonadota bacterium]